MSGVIQGFGVIGAIVLVGYVLGRTEVLGDNGRDVLAKISFYVGTPALLLQMLSESDVRVLFSAPLLVTALSTFAAAALFVLVALWRRWNIRRTTIGALCSSYVNAGNLGIPVAVYVLGDATLVAPVMLFQLLVMTPIGLSVIDFAQAGEKASAWSRLLAPFKNPIVICSLLGVSLSLLGWRIPGPVSEPLTLLGHLSVPTVLLAFGVSLRGSQLPAGGAERWPVLVSVGLKSFAHPVIAWAIGAGLFGMEGAPLFAAVVISALPAAQNLFVYASRCCRGPAGPGVDPALHDPVGPRSRHGHGPAGLNRPQARCTCGGVWAATSGSGPV